MQKICNVIETQTVVQPIIQTNEPKKEIIIEKVETKNIETKTISIAKTEKSVEKRQATTEPKLIKEESKEEMKKRGIASPDHGDALALTFAVKVARRDTHARRGFVNDRPNIAKGIDYDPFAN